MSALNRQETDALQDAVAVLEGVLKEGFTPGKPEDGNKGRRIKIAKDQIRTVITMKGHYPS